MSTAESESAGGWEKRFGEYGEKLLQALLLTIPLAIVAKLNDSVSATIFNQPWQAIWFLVPLAIVIWVLRRGIARREHLYPDRSLLAFLAAYILLFVIASQANFLDLSRDLTAFGAPASRRWLTPVSWGDWRYRLVPRKPDPGEELIVALLKPAGGRTLVDTRKDLVDLIGLSARSGAKGVALDVYFEEASPIDPLLCHIIATAGIPVIVGFGFDRKQGHISEIPPPDSLQPCLTPDRQAHLAGFLDLDLVTRMTPMYFRSDRRRPALGLAVARALAGGATIDVPPDGQLRFIAPAEPPPTATLDQLQTDRSWRDLLRNRFVLAGEASERDSFQTAFGRQYGIVIHSYVAHSLRQGHFIRRQSWWLGLAVIVVCCYSLTLWCANGAPARRLVTLCAGATAIVVATAVASILIGPYWFDVVYPIIATWLLLALLLGLRRAMAARAGFGTRGSTLGGSEPRN